MDLLNRYPASPVMRHNLAAFIERSDMRKLFITLGLTCLSICDAQSGEPHAFNGGVFSGIPNVAVLILATPKDGGAVSAEAFGTYSTLAGCEEVRSYYLRTNPAMFGRRGVDFVCLIDAYDPSPFETTGQRSARPAAPPYSFSKGATTYIDEALKSVPPIAVKVIAIGIGAICALVGLGFAFRGLILIGRGLVRCVRGYRKGRWDGLVRAAKEKLW
jgi:hypothetical protein